ncbi:MAG: carboxylating nicotinate-nucleotide diphosphorylase [Thermoanaerobaculia bacterium]|nr:carboxylating nicotinate-nucleotide diphosphorylase [Thermoanaerobaculia bacterium]
MTGRDVAVPPPLLWREQVAAALREDLGFRDLTSEAVASADARAAARFVARREGRIAGLFLALEAVRQLDPELRVAGGVEEASDVAAGATLARIEARARAVLAAERVALNFLGHLSGIATATRDVVRAVGDRVRVVETRKTTPGLRLLEKYAVRAGGGRNHRYRLDDAILIKDNHIALAGGLEPALRRCREAAGHTVRVEVEVDGLDQLEVALAAGADVVLLDNFTVPELEEAVARNAGRAVLEASGGITPDNAARLAATGVDVLSMGWLTQSAPALDVALDFEDSPSP